MITPQPTPPDQAKAPKLLDQVRDKIRLKHYSIRTEQAYVDWIKRFVLFHHKRHPAEMGAVEVEAFLTHLAVEGNVAASTQNQGNRAINQDSVCSRFESANESRNVTESTSLLKGTTRSTAGDEEQIT